MQQLVKSALATAVGLAISGGAVAASLDQYRMNTPLVTDHIPVQQDAVSLTEGFEASIPSGYYVVLKQAALSELRAGNADDVALNSLTAEIENLQQQVTQELMTLDREAEVLLTTRNLASGLVVKASDAALESLRQSAAVEAIYPLFDSKPMLAQSVEYMNARGLITSGTATGKGMRVAVLDSGVDYTHKSIGGVGTVAAYAAVNQRVAPAWPQGKVLGGYDFINNDPNPIDPSTGGHGTFVASSVLATAPDANLYAYTVCTGTCPAAAQIGALEASMDPNGDGNLADRVDVVNMSLGGQFGSATAVSGTQFLIQRAAALGVNMVISAGNDGPNPFRVGGPSTTPNALSVGAMTHPTGTGAVFENNTIDGKRITMLGSGFNPTSAFAFDQVSAPLAFVKDNALGCNPFAADSLKDKAVLIDRGTCNFTAKVINAQNAGAKFVILVNNAAGAGAFSGGGADPAVKIPSVGISLEDGAAIKAALEKGAVNYNIKSVAISTAGGIATFTSRGPAMQGLLKPEITAPGTNILMAAVGSGDKFALNSGTSFSGPLTAGAIAQLRQALPNRNAQEIKATIMNAANPEVYNLPKAHPQAVLAPISAIGAGLVDVEKAAKLPVAAWVEDTAFDTKQAALSFGLQTLTQKSTLKKTVTLKNFGTVAKTYNLRIRDRFAADTATGALAWTIPSSVTVQPGQTTTFDVSVTVDPAKLPAFGLQNTTPTLQKDAELTKVEYDGALVFDDPTVTGDYDLHLVYHLIPQAQAQLDVTSKFIDGKPQIVVKNNGAVAADVYSTQLVATDPREAVTHDIRAVSLDVITVPTTTCSSGYLLAPTITLDKGLNHLLQANLGFDLDVNNDGRYDFSMYSILLTRLGDAYAGVPGLMGTFAVTFGTTSGFVYNMFHATGQRNVTLSACFERIGLVGADIGKKVSMRAFTVNNGFALGLGSNIPADDMLTAEAVVAPAADVTFSAGGKDLTKLEPGAEAIVTVPKQTTGRGFVLLSDVGDAMFSADLTPARRAPVVPAGQAFSVRENSANASVIGQLVAEADFSNSLTEFFLAGSTSASIGVEKDGRVVVKGPLDFDKGTTSATLEVVALNSAGLSSAPVKVAVTVTNVADEKPVVTLGSLATDLREGTPAGTVVGKVSAEIREAGATLRTVTVSPDLFAYANGNIVLARSVGKADTGTQSLSVTATDSSGMASDAVSGSVQIAKKSSGSFGFIGLLLLPLALLRRSRKA